MVAGYVAAGRGSMVERWMARTWVARTWMARIWITRIWVVIAAAVVCVAVAARPAEAHWNNFNSVRPRCGQKGSTVEVKISGNYIADPQEFIFYRPGIKAVDISYEGKFEHGTVKCTFEIAPDCPPGEHVFRIRTKTQLTNAATFHVSPFPVIDEVEGDKERKTPDNDSLAAAMPVPSNVTVRGTVSGKPKDDVDIYRVPVTAGGRLSVEVDAIRISDIPHTHGVEPNSSDLAVRVLDANGRELAINDDNPLHTQDPLVSLKLPADYPSSGADGTVAYVEVRRTIFGSGPSSRQASITGVVPSRPFGGICHWLMLGCHLRRSYFSSQIIMSSLSTAAVDSAYDNKPRFRVSGASLSVRVLSSCSRSFFNRASLPVVSDLLVFSRFLISSRIF